MYKYLSHYIDSETPTYGNYNKPSVESEKSILKGDAANTQLLNFSNHTGTHIDFPYHFSEKGKNINNYPADFWIFNNPFVLEIIVNENEIINFVKQINLIPKNVDFLIIKTDFQKFRNNEKYWKNNPGIEPEMAFILKENFQNIKVIGFDFISISSFNNRPLGREAHKAFLIDSDILIVEDMNLSNISDNISQIFCFPLLINKTDGTPVTIICKYNE